jgi:hypothetical protein
MGRRARRLGVWWKPTSQKRDVGHPDCERMVLVEDDGLGLAGVGDGYGVAEGGVV